MRHDYDRDLARPRGVWEVMGMRRSGEARRLEPGPIHLVGDRARNMTDADFVIDGGLTKTP